VERAQVDSFAKQFPQWRAVSWALGGIALAWTTGCATTGATEEDMSKLRREVRTLKADLEEAKSNIQRLENQVTVMTAGRAEYGTQTVARDPGQKSMLPKLPVVRLDKHKQAAPAQEDPQDLGAMDDGSPPVMIKLGPEGGEKISVDKEVLDKPDPVLSTKGAAAEKKSMQADYDRALDTLRGQRRPTEARALFTAFKSKYPESPLADNAAFWVAECSFVEEQHARAIQEFSQLIDRHPMSAKVPDALLRVGQSFSKLGKTEEARQALRKVTRGYPGSEAAQEADKILRALDPGKVKE
jgi:tol-pal system protein YbgF